MTSNYSALEALNAAGLIREGTPDAVKEVFDGLNQDEVSLLSTLHTRILNAVTPEVTAHSDDEIKEDLYMSVAQIIGLYEVL